MLVARPAKRDAGTPKKDILFEIVEGEAAIGRFAFGIDTMRGTITLAGKAYDVAHTGELRNEMLHEALIRSFRGGEKPRNVWNLSDEAGRIVALGERTGERFVISRGGERFSFRRKGWPYHLYRDGSESSLGFVGQRKFFTRLLHMDLPEEFDRPFQVFLLVLLLSLSLQNLESLTRSR